MAVPTNHINASPLSNQVPPLPSYVEIQPKCIQVDPTSTPYQIHMQCPHCYELIRTNVVYHSKPRSSCFKCLKVFGYILLGVLCILFVVLLVFLICAAIGGGSGHSTDSCGPCNPCRSSKRQANAENCSKAIHICPKCSNVIGIFERTCE